MDKNDLEVGYVVRIRDGTMLMVMSCANGKRVIADNNGYVDLSNYTHYLTHTVGGGVHLINKGFDIMEVYGRAKNPLYTLDLNIAYRSLIWKRDETKEITLSELEDIIGYKFRIVEEKIK